MRRVSVWQAGLLGLALWGLGPMGCGSDGGGSSSGAETGAVVGTLLDARSGGPIAGAQVTLDGRTVESNEQGYFTLDQLPAGEPVLLQITHPDRPRVARPVTVAPGTSTYVRWRLLAFEATVTFDAAAGGVIEARGAQVTFGPNVVGATGAVTARLARLDATAPSELAAFPGDFRTDQNGRLESFGAVAVELTDAAGQRINIAPGSNANLALPVPAGSADTIPLWYFDEAAGRWVESGALTGCADGACDAVLPHLSWWNADIVLETTCATLCVTDDEGAPAVGVVIEASGQDYNGRSEATTGADGCACIEVRRGSTVEIVGVGVAGVVGPIVYTSQAAVAACGDAACERIEQPLVVSRPRFQAILTWGDAPSDLDAHFTGPLAEGDRFHISYSNTGNASAPPYAVLDTDDTDSRGPEITTLFRCEIGTYRYGVHNYSGEAPFDGEEATVTVLLPDGSSHTHHPPAGDQLGYWLVGELECAANCQCRWTGLDQFADGIE
jgi:hypothetical protein